MTFARMLVIFDFDNTLFDTKTMLQDLETVFLEAGVAADAIGASYAVVAPGGIGYELAAQQAELARHLSAAAMEAVRQRQAAVLSRLVDYVPEGAGRLLERLTERGDELHLLTSGSDSWQRLKITSSGLAGYFSGIHVVAGSKTETMLRLVAEGDGRAVIVNDNPDELREAMQLLPQARVIAVAGPLNEGQEMPCELARDIDELANLML